MCSNNGSTTYFYFSITKQKLVSDMAKKQNELELHVALLVDLVVWSGVGVFGVE